jgi:hypothetical protein
MPKKGIFGGEKELNWSKEQTIVGIPTLALLPSKNFYFKVQKAKHKITIPKSGLYKDLNEDYFSEDDGDFVVFDEKNSVCYLSVITKVLFALDKYPELKYNELFCPLAISFNDTTIDIFGQIISMLEPPEGDVVDRIMV